jgi:hypothetical protein
MSATRLNVSLERYEIGLSGAVPDRSNWSEPAMDRAILEFVALFSGIIFKYGGRIVHGSHPTFSSVILRQARLHAGLRSRKPVTLVMSELWAKDLTEADIDGMTDVAELIITRQIGNGGPTEAKTRNDSLSAMRRVLIDSQNMMVAVGGKMHAADGNIAGIQEEMDLAKEKDVPRFLLAGMGGYAAQYARDLTPSALHNGLPDEENILLFGTNDVSACVNVLFEHLATSRDLAQLVDQPVRWNPDNRAVIDHRDGTIDSASTGHLLRIAI